MAFKKGMSRKAKLEHLEDLLWRSSIVHPDTGCYLWLGTLTRNGHGSTSIWHPFGNWRVDLSVNRLSAFLFLGLDLDDKSQIACHKTFCYSPNCWRPEHLYVGTMSDNIKDDIKKGIRSKYIGKNAWINDSIKEIVSIGEDRGKI